MFNHDEIDNFRQAFLRYLINDSESNKAFLYKSAQKLGILAGQNAQKKSGKTSVGADEMDKEIPPLVEEALENIPFSLAKKDQFDDFLNNFVVNKDLKLNSPAPGMVLAAASEELERRITPPDSSFYVTELKRLELKKACRIYMDHLLKELKIEKKDEYPAPDSFLNHSQKYLAAKYKAVYEMIAPLNNKKTPEECIANFDKVYNQKDRQAVIKSHRDSVGVRFLNIVASLLSLGIKNLVTAYQSGWQYWGFWQTRGESLKKHITEELKDTKKPDPELK